MPRNQKTIRPFASEPGFTPFDNHVLDEIMPSLSGSTWKVLCFFLRKTIGWRKTGDQLSYSQIAKGTGIKSDTTITKALEVLIGRGYIVRVPPDAEWEAAFYFLNTDFEVGPDAQGATTEGEQPAPADEKKCGEPAPKNGATLLQKMERDSAAPAPKNGDTIKSSGINTQPHTHRQTRLRAVGAPAGVGVVGALALKAYERYGRNQPGIRDAVAWAITARRSGEFDERVRSWCAEHGIDPSTGESEKPQAEAAPPPPASALDASKCPDCSGTGWWYPEGFSKGTARCRHPRLTSAA